MASFVVVDHTDANVISAKNFTDVNCAIGQDANTSATNGYGVPRGAAAGTFIAK